MEPDVAAQSGAKAGRREYLGLAVLGLPTVLISLDMSVLYLAVPHLTQGLHASALQQLWITDIYGFVVSGFLIMMSSLGDRIGRKRLLLIGAALFAVMSLATAFSTSPEMLIAARAGLGVAGATLMPSTMTLLRSMFPNPAQYMKAIGVWMACFMGGMAFGPVVGGVLLQFFWWGSVFLLGVPVMAVLLLFGPRLLPEYRNPDAGPLDVVSALLSLATILPIIYGLKELVQNGAGSVQLAALAIGVVVGVLFVRRQQSLAVPMLDLSLFRNRTFGPAITMTVFGGVMAGTNFFVYQYLQTVQHLEPLHAALWLLPSSITIIVGLNLAPRLGQKIRPAYVIAGGLVLVAIGYLVLTQAGDGRSGLAVLVTGLVISGVGIGPMGALGSGLALGSVPMEKAGSAASMNQVAGDFGIAMGVALIGVVGTTVCLACGDRLDVRPPHSVSDLAGHPDLHRERLGLVRLEVLAVGVRPGAGALPRVGRLVGTGRGRRPRKIGRICADLCEHRYRSDLRTWQHHKRAALARPYCCELRGSERAARVLPNSDRVRPGASAGPNTSPRRSPDP